MPAASPTGSASPTTSSTTSSASRRPSCSRSPTATSAGETPIPCVVCNQQIKFHELLATARELEADALATGHYIELRAGAGRPRAVPRPRCRARPELLPVRHHARPARLAAVSRSAPMRKAEVRALARELRAARRRQVRQPGHLLRAAGPLHQRHRAPEARRRRGRRHRARRRPRARPPRRHHQLHHRPAPRPRRPGPGPALRRAPRCGDQAGRGRPARELACALDHP